jgi:excisionase family DNA binding protein
MNLLTAKEAAALLGISHRTLAAMRLKGSGPTYVKVGWLVRYPKSKLEEWLLSHQRISTSPTGAIAGHGNSGDTA